MIGMPCAYRRDSHRIIHPRFLNWIRRQLADVKLRESLFVYYHLIHRNFVIAHWKVPCRYFVDILNLGHSLENFDQETAKNLITQLRTPISGSEMAEILRDKERKWLTMKQDDNDDRADRFARSRTQKIMDVVPSNLQGTMVA
jgi:hypothetical protein